MSIHIHYIINSSDSEQCAVVSASGMFIGSRQIHEHISTWERNRRLDATKLLRPAPQLCPDFFADKFGSCVDGCGFTPDESSKRSLIFTYFGSLTLQREDTVLCVGAPICFFGGIVSHRWECLHTRCSCDWELICLNAFYFKKKHIWQINILVLFY